MSKFVPLILFIATIGLFFLYIDGQYKEFFELRSEKKSYENALVKAHELEKRREELQQKKAEFTPDELERLAKVLPDGADSIRLNMDLNGIASRYGMEIKKVEISRLEKTDGASGLPTLGPDSNAYDTYELKFSVESDYFGFSSFLKDLETSLRLVDVKSMNITATSRDKYVFGVTGLTYALKPDAKKDIE